MKQFLFASIWKTIVADHFGWYIGTIVTLIGGGLVLLVNKGSSERRKRFQGRTVLSDADWFTSVYPTAPVDQDFVRRAARALASDIGIEWTLLHPCDTFEEMFRIGQRHSRLDDLDGAEYQIIALAGEFGIPHDHIPGFTGSLKEFLDLLIQAKRKQQLLS